VKSINAFWDRQARSVFELEAVRNMHGHEMPPDPKNDFDPMSPLHVLLHGALGDSCNKVDQITFVPGEKEIIQEGNSIALNIWTKPKLVPVEGNASPFLSHVEYILDGDAPATNHVLNYLAHLVQRPAEKIKSTVLIVGTFGIGKSAIGEMMMPLWRRELHRDRGQRP
jgi:hypothetical protein